MSTKKLIVILGPTASGKTALGIKLAKKFDGEVVSADSRQIYKEMDIATAKPPQSQNSSVERIPHYLMDVVKPDEEFNAAIYKKLALSAIKDIQKKGKVPFLVGGSPFYIYAVVEGWVFPKLKADKVLRKDLEKKSTSNLLSILKKLDAPRAKNIEKKNKRRLIRAIEIAKMLGKVPCLKKNPQFDCLILGIKPSNEELKIKISKRVQNMFKLGLEKEAENLIKKYGSVPSLQTIGYQEWLPYLKGEITKKEVAEKIKTHTWQFARRQETWFKRDKRINWVNNYRQAEKLVKEFLTINAVN